MRLCKKVLSQLPLLILAAVTVRASLRYLPLAAMQVLVFRAASQDQPLRLTDRRIVVSRLKSASALIATHMANDAIMR